MLFATHLIFGLLIYLASITYTSFEHSWLALIVFFIGVLTPDIDTRHSRVARAMWPTSAVVGSAFGHRGLIHSLIGAMMFSWIVFGIVYLLGYSGMLAIWYFLGYITHMAADSFTRRGVAWAAPVSDKRVKFLVRTSAFTESLFLGFTLFAIFLIAIKNYIG